ncbi:hypothetical protein WA158_007707 [Blastocystis sp. Blastoise]
MNNIPKPLAKDLRFNFIYEYCVTIVFCVLSFVPDMFDPNYQEFIEQDISISHSYTDDVSSIWFYVAYFVPLLICTILVVIFDTHSKWMYFNVTCVLSLKNLFLVKLVCGILQNFFGRPRPNAFAMCGYTKDSGSALHVYGYPGRVASIDNCKQSISLIRAAFRSFPSSYAALGMAGAVLSILLLSQFSVVFELYNRYFLKVFRFFLFAIILVIPIRVSVILTEHNMNFTDDILAGFLIGICISYFTVKQYYTNTTSLYMPLRQSINMPDIEVHNIHVPKDNKL